ncbi:hypothetical protein dqs_0881 [Azoarcus olearius]|uniref:STAS domain-containing protein n=1 Tax=Azoarcus sp. (strain BH72) TaxID=418699 RepID=UPI00080613FC|nr:STAS domain-containing protein [Azoarcus olearius]ANQ83949.1 hypothetical protein dqs_0881 [Azoarcus olearius]
MSAGDALRLEGEITLATASGWRARGRAALVAGVRVVDFAAVTHVDSAALALLLEWRRCARAGAGGPLRVANLPPALVSLAEVYGIDSLLPVAA